jgi:hypothetical protein
MSLISILFQIIDEWKTRVRAGTGKGSAEELDFAEILAGEGIMLAYIKCLFHHWWWRKLKFRVMEIGVHDMHINLEPFPFANCYLRSNI